MSSPPIHRWCQERQFVFLHTLERTRCVRRSAAAAAMSRESAYRLRAREPRSLFTLLWDDIMRRPPARVTGGKHRCDPGKHAL